jgi:hypothetical protein
MMKMKYTIAALAATTMMGHAAVVWQEDWTSQGEVQMTDTNFDIAGVQNIEELNTSVQAFEPNSNPQGGFDLIPVSSTNNVKVRLEVMTVAYAADTQYKLNYIIGTGSSNSRNGNWFVEFGRVSGSSFISLSGVQSTGAITLNTDENFNDIANLTTTFGGNGIDEYYGGRELSFTFDPDFAAEGEILAVRFGTTASNAYAGFSDMNIETIAVPEPSSTALLGLGGLALILRRRK